MTSAALWFLLHSVKAKIVGQQTSGCIFGQWRHQRFGVNGSLVLCLQPIGGRPAESHSCLGLDEHEEGA